ncbi:Speckle-type POZ protein-like protein [Hordeum vulgare]|nr:Speckle-type POZ protein-like protein [Hordeum vulgare]
MAKTEAELAVSEADEMAEQQAILDSISDKAEWEANRRLIRQSSSATHALSPSRLCHPSHSVKGIISPDLSTQDVVAVLEGTALVDQTTGVTVPLFREKDPILFDASSEETCTWGTGEVARRSHLHAGSRYVLGDRLKIKCAIDVCGDFLTFDDPPPTPSSGLPLFQQVGYDQGEPNVIIQVEGGTIGMHYCILDAHCTIEANSGIIRSKYYFRWKHCFIG